MNEFWQTITALGTAIVTVAIVAVIVSKNAQSPAVIQAGGSAFTNALATAVSPVTGGTASITTAYPGSSSGSGTLGFNPSDLLGEFG